jgi:CBS domain-containing protein
MYEFLDYQVQDVMSQPVCVRAETTLAEAEALLEKNGWNGVPVVDEAQRAVGFVTSLDLLKAFAFPEDTILPSYERILTRPVSEVMTRDLFSVCPRTPLTRVLQKLVDTRSKSFPVIDDDRVVGVVAREDVMGALRRAAEGKRP